MAELHGKCDPRFQRAYDAMAENIDSGKEVGSSLYVNIDGEDVIDLWGGWREKEHKTPWTEDTIVNVFSGGKTIASVAVLMLADRGQLDLYAPVAKYWPEFAQNGKEKVEVRHFISHTSGVPAWEPPFTMDAAMDLPGANARLAAQAPWWEPGTRGSYHASSFGHLNGELVRRVTGMTLGQFIAKEIAGPLKADYYLGLNDEQIGRTATVYPAPEDIGKKSTVPKAATEAPKTGIDPLATERAISVKMRLGSFSGTGRDPLVLFNSPEWRRVEFGGSSGHGNARGLGRILTVLANGGVSRGVKLLSPQTISQIFQEQWHGTDSYYMRPIRWGLGYALASDDNTRGPLPFIRPGKKTCFWYGTGGSLFLADAERRITFSYAMNQCQSGKNSLNGVFYNAVYDSL